MNETRGTKWRTSLRWNKKQKTWKKHSAKMQFQLCIMHKSNFLCVHQHRREFKISFPLFIVESFFFHFFREANGKFFKITQSRKTAKKNFLNRMFSPVPKTVESLAFNLHKFVLFMFVSLSRWHNKFHLHLEEISPPPSSRNDISNIESPHRAAFSSKRPFVKCAKCRARNQKIS